MSDTYTSHIEAMRQWLLTSGLFPPAEKVNMNYLDTRPMGFAVVDVTEDPVAERYIDGTCLYQKSYEVQGRMPYGGDRKANARSSDLFGRLSAWIMAQDEAGNYPVIGAVQSLAVRGSGGILYADESTAVYSIPIHITYL